MLLTEYLNLKLSRFTLNCKQIPASQPSCWTGHYATVNSLDLNKSQEPLWQMWGGYVLPNPLRCDAYVGMRVVNQTTASFYRKNVLLVLMCRCTWDQSSYWTACRSCGLVGWTYVVLTAPPDSSWMRTTSTCRHRSLLCHLAFLTSLSRLSVFIYLFQLFVSSAELNRTHSSMDTRSVRYIKYAYTRTYVI